MDRSKPLFLKYRLHDSVLLLPSRRVTVERCRERGKRAWSQVLHQQEGTSATLSVTPRRGALVSIARQRKNIEAGKTHNMNRQSRGRRNRGRVVKSWGGREVIRLPVHFPTSIVMFGVFQLLVSLVVRSGQSRTTH